MTGAATVISAMGAGKRAAADIDRDLSGEPVPTAEGEAVAQGRVTLEFNSKKASITFTVRKPVIDFDGNKPSIDFS